MALDNENVTPPFNRSNQWHLPEQHFDKRAEPRIDMEGKIRVLKIDSKDQYDEIALYLRDTSKSGLSGTYFGDDPLAANENYLLKSAELEQRLRLVWSQQTIEGIHMCGFQRITAS